MVSIHNTTNSPATGMSHAQQSVGRSMERLASGSRLNSARDNAAGMAISQLFLADVATAQQSSRNIADGISMVQTADGAAGAIGDNLIRMNQLAAQASNGTLSDQQKTLIQQEFDDLSAENVRISEATTFNGISLLESGHTVDIALGDGGTLGIETGVTASVSGDLVEDAASAQSNVETAINQLSALRAGLGTAINRLERAGDVTATKTESLMAAVARISDTDIAQETATMTANLVLIQMTIALSAQANNSAQHSLQLLN